MTEELAPRVTGHFLLSSDELPGVSLRSAEASDCERLRVWKNAHRQYFFFQDIITEPAQRAWFDGYCARSDDAMFVVQAGRAPVGCMGIRLRDRQADVYNVILGRPEYAGRGVMAQAMRLMCSDALRRWRCEIVARVVKDNPALAWYRNRGFRIVSESDSHFMIKLDEAGFVPVSVVRREIPL